MYCREIAHCRGGDFPATQIQGGGTKLVATAVKPRETSIDDPIRSRALFLVVQTVKNPPVMSQGDEISAAAMHLSLPATVQKMGYGTVAKNFILNMELHELSRIGRATEWMAEQTLNGIEQENNVGLWQQNRFFREALREHGGCAKEASVPAVTETVA